MRVPLIAMLLLAGSLRAAEALTVRDVIELTRSGVSEDVLLALIEVDAGVYPTDPATIKRLQEAGVSQRVMVALVRSGRERPAEVPPPLPEPEAVATPPPTVVVIEHHDAPQQPVVVPVPVYVPVDAGRRRGPDRHSPSVESTYVPFQSGPPAARPEPARPKEPVYWGFGGKLRPDAWGQPSSGGSKAGEDGRGNGAGEKK